MSTIKYFLNSEGVETKRIAGRAGAGHIEIAQATEQLDPKTDIYQQMYALGYVRVQESDTEVQIDAPSLLTIKQKQFLTHKRKAGKRVIVNALEFIHGRA